MKSVTSLGYCLGVQSQVNWLIHTTAGQCVANQLLNNRPSSTPDFALRPSLNSLNSRLNSFFSSQVTPQTLLVDLIILLLHLYLNNGALFVRLIYERKDLESARKLLSLVEMLAPSFREVFC